MTPRQNEHINIMLSHSGNNKLNVADPQWYLSHIHSKRGNWVFGKLQKDMLWSTLKHSVEGECSLLMLMNSDSIWQSKNFSVHFKRMCIVVFRWDVTSVSVMRNWSNGSFKDTVSLLTLEPKNSKQAQQINT